jgi:N-acetylated-alpha-linked acidic dipeptidase
MLEISRALSELKINKGWKPKRSLIFCSWGAEEYGLIGLIYHQNIKL